MEQRTRVVIVEDHALTRAGLRTSLEAAFEVAGEAADGLAGWETIERERPDVAVIDTAAWADAESVEDDRLRLVFTCCHPALAFDAQVALTLREVCGLTTEEIAHAFLTPAPTLAQRIVRAKAKIRGAAIPYRVPSFAELPERLTGVMVVIYLVFNEGYAATRGDALVRLELCAEAIHLGRLLRALLTDPVAEVDALLALMLLQDARSASRVDARGEMVLLPDQDRARWNQSQIGEARGLLREALRRGPAATPPAGAGSAACSDPGRPARQHSAAASPSSFPAGADCANRHGRPGRRSRAGRGGSRTPSAGSSRNRRAS